MIELRFLEELYSGRAIDAAVKAFEGFAKAELRREPGVFIVELTSTSEHDETTIARELENYALGATVDEGRAGSV